MSKLNKQWVYIIPLVLFYCMISNFTVTDVHSEERCYFDYDLRCPSRDMCCGGSCCPLGKTCCDQQYDLEDFRTTLCCKYGKCCGVADGGGFNVIEAFGYEDCNCTKKDSSTEPQEDADICCAYCSKVKDALSSIPDGQVRGTIDDYSGKIYCKILGYTDPTEPYFCCSDDEICTYDETHCVGVTVVNDKVNFEITDTRFIDYRTFPEKKITEFWNGTYVTWRGTYFIKAKIWAKKPEYHIHKPIKVIVNELEYVQPSDEFWFSFIKLGSATEGDGTKGSKQTIDIDDFYLSPFPYDAVYVEFAINLLRKKSFKFYVDVEAFDL